MGEVVRLKCYFRLLLRNKNQSSSICTCNCTILDFKNKLNLIISVLIRYFEDIHTNFKDIFLYHASWIQVFQFFQFSFS